MRLSIRSRLVFTFLFFAISAASFADKQQAAQNYEKGLQAFDNGQIKEAVIHLKNAIQQDESYLAAYVLLGKAHLKVGDGASAEKELTRAIRLGADKTLTMQSLAEALLMQNKYAEVVKQIPGQGFASDLQSDLLVARGEAFLELGDAEKAKLAYEAAQKLNPASIKPYLGLAAVAMRSGDFNEAEKQISHALDYDFKSPGASQLKASMQHAQGHSGAAIEYYTKALDAQPEFLTALLGRAALYLDTNQIDKAETDVTFIREKFPLDPRGTYLDYKVKKAQGKQDEAQAALSAANAALLKIAPESLNNHGPLLLLAGITSFELRQFEKANEYLAQYLRKNPSDLYAQKIYGSVLLGRGEDREAIRVLESVYAKTPRDYQLLTLLGTAYANARLYVKANEMFDAAIVLHDQGTPARLQRALNELTFGKNESALEDLAFVFEKNNDARAGLMLTTLYFKQRDMQKAETIARKLVTREPDNMTARNFLVVAQLETGKLGEARKNLNALLKQDAEFFPAQMNMAKLDTMEGKLAEAEKRLNGLLDKKKNLSTVMLALSALEERKRNRDEALRWAEKAHAADNKNISAILRVGELHLAVGQSDKALRVAEDGSAAYPENLQIARLLGRGYIAAGKTDRAKSVFRDMSQQASYDTQTLFDVARLQYEAGDVDGGVWSLRKAVEGDASFVPARHALIETLISMNDLKEAREQLTAIKPHASKALYARLEGDWNRASGESAKAVRNYEKAFELEPNTDLAIRLFGAYVANKQLDKGVSQLQVWEKQYPDDIAAKSMLAEGYLLQGKKDKASKLYEAILQTVPEHGPSLNNLANIYHESGRAEQAIKLARKAHQVAPDHPVANDTLGWILVEQGMAAEGLPFLRNANARASRDPEIRYHIAVALYKLDRKDESRQALSALLEENQADFPGRGDAEKLLKRISN